MGDAVKYSVNLSSWEQAHRSSAKPAKAARPGANEGSERAAPPAEARRDASIRRD